eukprot:1165462_1
MPKPCKNSKDIARRSPSFIGWLWSWWRRMAFMSDAWLAVVGEVPFTISRRRRRSGGRDILSDLGDLGDGRGCGGGRGSEAGGFGGGGGGGRKVNGPVQGEAAEEEGIWSMMNGFGMRQ